MRFSLKKNTVSMRDRLRLIIEKFCFLSKASTEGLSQNVGRVSQPTRTDEIARSLYTIKGREGKTLFLDIYTCKTFSFNSSSWSIRLQKNLQLRRRGTTSLNNSLLIMLHQISRGNAYNIHITPTLRDLFSFTHHIGDVTGFIVAVHNFAIHYN